MIAIARKCPACDELFMPDKFHPRQVYCTSESCKENRRQQYKQRYNRQWRQENPGYFREYWIQYRQMG